MSIHIGTSGWAYNHWRNVLYPKGVPARVWLEKYASEFDTVEFNGSFYRWPREEAFAAYQDRLQEGYVFSVKAPRGLTHGRKLRDPDEWIGRIERCFAALGDRSGVFLLQLSPDMERDDDRLDYILAKLPDNIRVAVEFRHDSWNDEEVFQLLECHGAAYTVMSGAHLPCTLRATAPFVYVRLHGPNPEQLYVDSYTEEDLQWWAARIREWDAAGKDVYAYFNNDLGGHAVRNAWRLRELTSM
ncbi:DUF72 domain-containing protein [Arthrobacter sp. zg-Y895]|uniref:DUF72 domain-containing protein n=1 Tax=Arthrobacter sp. zg-Y895 TaxID=2886933 RepID=UPI001D1362EB|nr:DUF72 domain-containing protein [Arthrobacter sp. zg-Y895]